MLFLSDKKTLMVMQRINEVKKNAKILMLSDLSCEKTVEKTIASIKRQSERYVLLGAKFTRSLFCAYAISAMAKPKKAQTRPKRLFHNE